VRDIQAGLQRLGYDPGAADGRFGAKTESAIRQYQQDSGLPVDGQPTASLLQNIRSRIAG
jgi:peptidoglycan hydrolase-like protein with peptidoglycan-binding domain